MEERLYRIIEKSKNIVFFGGAGVSTESGIPDFRGNTGLYNAVHDFGVTPEEILSNKYFYEHTDNFYKYYFENLIHLEAKPNAAHEFLALLEKRGKLKTVITQNIDNLHQLAGSKNVIELHGSVKNNYCLKCHKTHSINTMMANDSYKCECGGIIKPNIILYGEKLNKDKIWEALEYVSNADLLIVGGTSLSVYPAASIIEYFKGEHLVLINKGDTQYDARASFVINDKIGEVFKTVDSKSNKNY